ncbi:Nucleotide-diphospho-sugar transferases protein [Dioscorea alata]|uniref:Nucleotide-diphospho-sugar transferases protein n=1 Tax=Dioscorea alata TaxID=55571 RepID=A0ACB7UYJ5_DIOAL|nr:Nucleotide-diphospho-sugar transferases protein [Dioscorea alata]
MWRCNHSLDACVDKILGRDWDRMKLSSADIIMKRYMNNPSRVKLLGKHMYPEEVFNDLNPNRTFTLWRFGYMFIEGNDVQKLQYNEVKNHKNSNSKEQPKQIIISNQCSDMITDPLDCIFGDLESSKEVSHSNNVGKRSRRRKLHGHKRAHRHYHHHRDGNQTENFVHT